MKLQLGQLRTKCVLFFLLAFACIAPALHAQDEKKELTWMTDYNDAIALSKKEAKPIFLYFSGSDWCSWCYRMDDEILKSPDFIKLVGNKFIFVLIDFPIYKALDAKLIKQNEELKEKYNVRGFPTIILLDADQTQIAQLNYREGGGKAYADYLLKILKEHEDFQKGVKSIKTQSSASLQSLYEKATSLSMSVEAQTILKEGITREDTLFFLKEYYRILLSNGQISGSIAKKVRAHLLAKDPDNKKHIHYDVAILDFEALSKSLPYLKIADEVLKPLQDYVAQFGDKDTKNRWKMEMTISQVYRSKNQLDKAIFYAKASKEHAPSYLKLDIAKLVSEIDQAQDAIAEAPENSDEN